MNETNPQVPLREYYKTKGLTQASIEDKLKSLKEDFGPVRIPSDEIESMNPTKELKLYEITYYTKYAPDATIEEEFPIK